jgi:hypothetical protein
MDSRVCGGKVSGGWRAQTCFERVLLRRASVPSEARSNKFGRATRIKGRPRPHRILNPRIVSGRVGTVCHAENHSMQLVCDACPAPRTIHNTLQKEKYHG